MIWSTDPSKMFQKVPQKLQGKTVQSNILWLNLNESMRLVFLQSAHKQGNPSFRFHAQGSKRRYPCTQTASAVPRYFPCLLQFCTVIASDKHLESQSEKRAENVDLHTAKNIQIQPILFRYF